MPRKAKAFYDQRAGCWASSAIGELKTTKGGKLYRTKVFNKELTHPTRDELAAQAWVHQVLQQQAAALIPIGDLTFRQLTEYYLQDAEHELSADAYDRRVEQLDRFGNWPAPDDPMRFDLRPCSRITAAEVKRFLEAMLAAGASESYVTEGLLKSIKRCFNWGRDVEPGRFPSLPLPANPVAKLKGPSIPRRAPREVDPVAVSRLIRWQWRRACGMSGLKQRFAKIAAIMVLCLRDTGARPKELCVACWDEWKVGPDGWGTLTLPPWKHKTGKKTGRARVIAFPPHLVRRVEWIRGLPGRHPQFIFTRRRDRGSVAADKGVAAAGSPFVAVDTQRKRSGHTKSLQKWFNRLRGAAIAAKVPINEDFRLYFHRSQYSTEGQRRGVPRALLAEAMGTSERMLERNYNDLGTADVLNTAKEVARRAKPNPPASDAG